jgi:hypothetical protein
MDQPLKKLFLQSYVHENLHIQKKAQYLLYVNVLFICLFSIALGIHYLFEQPKVLFIIGDLIGIGTMCMSLHILRRGSLKFAVNIQLSGIFTIIILHNLVNDYLSVEAINQYRVVETI